MRKLFTSTLLLFALAALVIPQTLLGGGGGGKLLGGQGVVRRAAAGGAADSPDDIAGLQLWLKGDDAATGDITTWTDASGNGRDATGVNTPQGVAAQLNGHKVVRFTAASDESFTVGDVAALELDTNSTVFFVVKFNTLTGNQLLSKDAGAVSAGAYAYQVMPSSNKLQVDRPYVEAGVESTNAVSTGTWYLLSATVSGTSVSHFKDGTANGTDTLATGTATNEPLQIGQHHAGGELDGDVAEIIVYNAALSGGDQDVIEAYIATTYGLTIP